MKINSKKYGTTPIFRRNRAREPLAFPFHQNHANILTFYQVDDKGEMGPHVRMKAD